MSNDWNEAETRAELIDPALKAAGWGEVEGSRIAREYRITLGRLQGAGKRAKADFADYVLTYRGHQLAVVEAKREDDEVTEGLGQAKDYACKLQVRFAFSTNGHGIYRVDMQTGKEGDIDGYPTPYEMWEATFGKSDAQEQRWRDKFSAIPFEDKGGQWQPRYYQHNAFTNALDAIAKGEDRVLLTLATGTGKTAIAFQIAWKLFHSRWNLTDWRNGLEEGQEPGRRPRILFLTDRNILADQAYNAFSAFPEDAMVRIAPDEIKKKGAVPKNASVFFTIFQTFMSGPGDSPYFGDYPEDFFDFIVIDECHRGGAQDESTWREILEYFSPAVQLGLTATPKRDINADTYAYFNEPVYVYSLKEGINDGYLTPFKVKQISTTIDEYVYTRDDMVMEGTVEYNKRYEEKDFNRIIEIMERERKRVEIFMSEIDQTEKTLVFCASQAHALAVRDLVNQGKDSSDPNYCHRVTSDDGDRGEQRLREFQDNEKTIPTILTTSHKLSTGVDARNVRNIVLMRPINSMIEFKQIIGRGTRLYDGKDYFTIYDFVQAHQHFNDPEWDGEPLEPVPPAGSRSGGGEHGGVDPPNGDGDSLPRPKKIKVKLADGKERAIQHMMMTTFWSPDGTPMSAQQFMELLFGALPEFFKSEDELREIWSSPDTRRKLLSGLAEKGIGAEQLAEMRRVIEAEKSDVFDVLANIAYALPPETRQERANRAKIAIRGKFTDKQRSFLEFVLGQYVKVGVEELDRSKLTPLLRLKYDDAISDAIKDLGRPQDISFIFADFQKHLYEQPEL